MSEKEGVSSCLRTGALNRILSHCLAVSAHSYTKRPMSPYRPNLLPRVKRYYVVYDLSERDAD